LAFGVLSGQDEALDFLQTGRIKITSRDKLLMCTDGLESILTNVKGDLHLQKMIAQGDIEGIMDYADHLDQTLKKRSDDKTLIIIDIQG
jgi:serine/threonine protein phosphatase PrpC